MKDRSNVLREAYADMSEETLERKIEELSSGNGSEDNDVKLKEAVAIYTERKIARRKAIPIADLEAQIIEIAQSNVLALETVRETRRRIYEAVDKLTGLIVDNPDEKENIIKEYTALMDAAEKRTVLKIVERDLHIALGKSKTRALSVKNKLRRIENKTVRQLLQAAETVLGRSVSAYLVDTGRHVVKVSGMPVLFPVKGKIMSGSIRSYFLDYAAGKYYFSVNVKGTRAKFNVPVLDVTPSILDTYAKTTMSSAITELKQREVYFNTLLKKTEKEIEIQYLTSDLQKLNKSLSTFDTADIGVRLATEKKILFDRLVLYKDIHNKNIKQNETEQSEADKPAKTRRNKKR